MLLTGLVLGLLPASPLKNRLLSMQGGWRVAREAVVDPVVLWRIERLEIAKGAHLGPLSVFRRLRSVQVEEGAGIGQLNWISCALDLVAAGGGTLLLRRESALTSRHYVDCTGGVTIGRKTIVGGVRSTFMTHQINVERSHQEAAGIEIGDECLLSTNVVVTPGRRIGNRCIVAAGAVVSSDLLEEETLYGGVPARPMRSRAGASYFDRERGLIVPG